MEMDDIRICCMKKNILIIRTLIEHSTECQVVKHCSLASENCLKTIDVLKKKKVAA